MTTEVASLKVVFTGDDSQLRNTISGVKSNLQSTGGQLSNVGQQIGTGIMQGIGLGVGLGVAGLTAQIAGLGPAMLSSAATFDNSFRNVNAILQLTNDELQGVKDQVLALGANSVAGPQMVASAYYEIVSAVADTSVHMDLLSQSIRTAEAGQADLIGTTNTMVSIMNAYRLSAKDAAAVSDTLTQTVAMGVGSMDAFGQAFASITGLGANLNISLNELGSELAFITTRGFSASEAATQLSSAMTAFINPSDKMKKALKEMGYESGSALIKAEGLAGAMEILHTAMGGNVDAIAELLGRKEALQAFLAITGEGFEDFFGKFETGVEGATEAAREMQLESVSQQWDMFKSKISAVGIALGSEFLPAANAALDTLGLLVDVGAEMLGIDLGFEVTGEAPDLAAEANRIIGPEPPPVDVVQAVNVTIERGEIPWNVWESEFSDQMSWETFRDHYYAAAAAAGLPNANITSEGVSFDVELAANTTTVSENMLSLENLNATIRRTGEELERVDKSSQGINKLAGYIGEIDADHLGMAALTLAAIGAPSVAAGIGATAVAVWGLTVAAAPLALVAALATDFGGVSTEIEQLGKSINEGDVPGALHNLADALGAIPMEGAERGGDFLGIDVEAGLAKWNEVADAIPVLVQTLVAKVAVSWIDMRIDAAETVNDIIASFNQLDDGVLGKLGINLDIEPIDVSGLEADKAAIEAAFLNTPAEIPATLRLVEDHGIDDMLANFSGEPISMSVNVSGLDELAVNLDALSQVSEEPLLITVGEDSYTSVADFEAALRAGTYENVAEPLPITISQNTYTQVQTLGTDIDYATRDRALWAQVNSNIGAVAYEINNTIADRVMHITLQIATANTDVPEPKALGGPVLAGETYLVGERGPELFTPESSGAIIPNHDLMSLSPSGGGSGSGGGGGISINGGTYNFYGVQDVAGFYEQMKEYAGSQANPGFAMERGS